MVRCWCVVCVLAVIAAVSASQPGERRATPDIKTSQPRKDQTPTFVGSSSCSARACHGGLEPIGEPHDLAILQDEYPKWLLRDKHTRAYQVLLEEPSRRIATNLAGEGVVRPPHKDERCLTCHTVPSPGHMQADLQLGVSCEACHGPASAWLPLHTRAQWRQTSPEQKRRQGMIPVADVSARAEACASCHVGSPGRDVNHDLIAAGHPRLNFEYASFMANLPPHWNTASAKRQAEDTVTGWVIGQIESAKASLRLLEHRAKTKEAPWPEFAEYDCFACHHDLTAESWRQARADQSRKPGTLPWGSWYFTMPHLLGESQFHTAFAEVRKVMERPLPARTVAASKLQSELKNLQGRLARLDSAKLRKLLADSPFDKSWDSAEQLFLAACAMPEMHKQKGLSDLNQYRALGPDWSSPKLFGPQFFDAFQNVMKAP